MRGRSSSICVVTWTDHERGASRHGDGSSHGEVWVLEEPWTPPNLNPRNGTESAQAYNGIDTCRNRYMP